MIYLRNPLISVIPAYRQAGVIKKYPSKGQANYLLLIAYCLLLTHYSSLRHLELAGFNQLSGFVAQLVNIYAAGEISQVDGGTVCEVGLFEHFSTQEIIDLDGKTFIVSFLKIESNHAGGRVWIGPHDGCLCIHTGYRTGFSLGFCVNGENNNGHYK